MAQRARRRMLVVDIVELVRGLLDRPTALVFEDLQWADDLSLEIIAELARATRDRPLVIVGTYRTWTRRRPGPRCVTGARGS